MMSNNLPVSLIDNYKLYTTATEAKQIPFIYILIMNCTDHQAVVDWLQQSQYFILKHKLQ